MNTLWQNQIVYRESCAFIKDVPARPVFPVAELMEVRHPLNRRRFEAGKDFVFVPCEGAFHRPPGSGIGFFDDNMLYPKPPELRRYDGIEPHPNGIPSGVEGKFLRFDRGTYFAERQFEITYRTDAALPALASMPIRRLNGRKINLVFTGDSITTGWNATGFLQKEPFEPCYAERTANTLRDAGGEVELHNFAVAGTRSAHGCENLAKWLENVVPDIMFIAFGMNDWDFPIKKYSANIRTLADIGIARNPNVKIFTVSPMFGNGEWNHTPPEISRRIATSLRELHYPCADVTAWWDQLFARKNYIELTGNGINHPNDYGHRVYAAVLEDILAKSL